MPTTDQESDQDIRSQIIALEKIKRRDCAQWQWRRVRYPFRAPLLFDCRFNGAAEQIVQGRYQKFLNDFHRVATSIKETGKISCEIDSLSAEMLEMLQLCKMHGWDLLKMSVRLKYQRHLIAQRVSQEIGRPASGDMVRRMGIGDHIVLAGVIQAVERKLGRGAVQVAYDPLYPSTGAIMGLAGLNSFPLPPDANISDVAESETTIIDMRRHMLEHPLCDNVPCYYGEEHGCPAAQTLWNLGWENEVTDHLVGHPKLTPKADAIAAARKHLPKGVPFIACQPLEMTRLNASSQPSAYATAMQMIGIDNILFGCAESDLPKLKRFVSDMALPSTCRPQIITESLPVWLAVIGHAEHMLTGNTSGMWLGFATNAKITIFSKRDEQHGTMWDVKEKWFTPERWRRIKLLL